MSHITHEHSSILLIHLLWSNCLSARQCTKMVCLAVRHPQLYRQNDQLSSNSSRPGWVLKLSVSPPYYTAWVQFLSMWMIKEAGSEVVGGVPADSCGTSVALLSDSGPCSRASVSYHCAVSQRLVKIKAETVRRKWLFHGGNLACDYRSLIDSWIK